MSFTIPVMTRKIGIESTISQMIPPKNILINTGILIRAWENSK